MHPIMKNYQVALQAIYDHVGFVEDWVVYPIDDQTDMVWKLDDDIKNVLFAKTIEDLKNEGDGKYYEAEIYTQGFYDKHIYRGKELTLIIVDHIDGNKFFMIFDNKKELENDSKIPHQTIEKCRPRQ